MEFARNGIAVKVLISALCLPGFIFLTAIAFLITERSELRCDAQARCTHIEHYAFGYSRQEELRPIETAETQWSPGGRVVALKLVLRHDDGTVSQYEGVGTNGDRAQETARQINAFVSAPKGPRDFPLREGSTAAGAFTALLALLVLLPLLYLFSRVRLLHEGNVLAITIERWPVPPKHLRLPIATLTGFGLDRKVVADQVVLVVCAEVAGQAKGIDLGLGFRNEAQALERIDAITAWYASVTRGQGGSKVALG